jgi:acetylornithine deacetylase
MIVAAQERLLNPAAVIVGEPTSMRIANQHKGICALRTRVRGVEAHSSLTNQGASAVMIAGELIAYLANLARGLAAEDRADRGFEPPYTTLSVNRIAGGTAFNTLAAACEFEWDIRPLPGDKPAQILEQLSSFAAGRLTELLAEGKRCAVETSVQADVPALEADHGPAEHLAQQAIQSTASPSTVPFATEAGQYQRAGWSTVICGPGSIEQAHKADEFLELSQLAACECFLDRAVANACRDNL